MRDEYGATRDWPFHVSCGGLVYRQVEGERSYLLLYRKPWGASGHETWHLPKGTLRRTETLEQGALREIREESGVDVEIEAYLGSLHGAWTDPRGRAVDRTVHYFLCRYLHETGLGMDHEHDGVGWVGRDEAIERLSTTRKREAEILRRGERLFQRAAQQGQWLF